jgi:hypothetical protein
MNDARRETSVSAAVAREGGAAVFTRHWSARAPLARVIEATRLELTPELHPLVTRVESLSQHGGASECWLQERVPLGPLRIPNRYRAARTVLEASESQGRIVLEAWAKLGVQLRHELTLRDANGRTEVTHVVRVTAPRVLLRFVAGTAQRAHDAWVERVVRWAERAG